MALAFSETIQPPNINPNDAQSAPQHVA